MASILDRHAATVMDRLNNGETFQAVCDWLTELDIRITRQSVHSWYSRKIVKIRARDPSSATAQAALTRKTVQDKPIKALQISNATEPPKSLEQVIHDGERQLGTYESVGQRFIGKPKQIDALTPAAFSQAFSRLSKGVKK